MSPALSFVAVDKNEARNPALKYMRERQTVSKPHYLPRRKNPAAINNFI